MTMPQRSLTSVLDQAKHARTDYGDESLFPFLCSLLSSAPVFEGDKQRDEFLYPMALMLRQSAAQVLESAEFFEAPSILQDKIRACATGLATIASLEDFMREGSLYVSSLKDLRDAVPADLLALRQAIRGALAGVPQEQAESGVLAQLKPLLHGTPSAAQVGEALRLVISELGSRENAAEDNGAAPHKKLKDLNQKLLERLIALLDQVCQERLGLDRRVFAPMLDGLRAIAKVVGEGQVAKPNDLNALNTHLEKMQALLVTERQRNADANGAYEKELLVLRARVRETEGLAFRDALTGIYNRRAFDKEIQSSITLAEAEGINFALLYIDLDNFKPINDQHGHAIGDDYLKAVTKKVAVGLRAGDFFCRFGGDEFAVIFPRCEPELSQKIAQRILQFLGDSRVEIPGHSLPLAASFGITSYRKGDSVESILKRADEALYAAKRAGKNRLSIG